MVRPQTRTLLPLGALAMLVLALSLLGGHSPVAAQGAKPFVLPFQTPPGPDTWLLGQPYGNTTGAYRQRYSTYSAVQGIHFGVDFTARCGTEVVAIGDGVVFAADNLNFGAAPHNLMIDHPGTGYSSFYGHLLARPSLKAGQRVKAGQVVGLSGDPDNSCSTRAHLHLEIRDLRHARKYNPVVLIAADWDNMALADGFPRTFQRDLDNPRKWQQLDQQPEVIIGGPILNNFPNTWPPDTRRR